MLVDVYRNLHKDTWSIRSRKTGRVVEHSDSVHIVNAKFVVQPSGRAKVLREGRKNVHAFVRGILHREMDDCICQEFANPQQVVYNPYESDKFLFKETGKPVGGAEVYRHVTLDQLGVWIGGNRPFFVSMRKVGIVEEVNLNADSICLEERERERIYGPVYIPEASIGQCKNVGKCKQYYVDLANGYCVNCWDKSRSTKTERLESTYNKMKMLVADTTLWED